MKLVHHQPMVLPAGHPLGGGYDVVRCTDCGLVYADSAVPEAAYERFYATLSKYADSKTGTGGGVLPWDADRLATTAGTIATRIRDRAAKIVDIGCAGGGLLRSLHEVGFRRLVGVDPSPECVAAVAKVPGALGLVGSFARLPLEAANADCVVLSHVLEHLPDFTSALAAARTLVRAGGCLFAEVPDATRYADCLAAPFQDFNTEHINHFGPTSLAAALDRAGFIVEVLERKTMEAAPGVPYPAIYAVARPAPVSAPKASVLAVDVELGQAIAHYVRQSDRLLEQVDRDLAAALAGAPQVAVWGVGQLTYKLLASTCLREAPIAALVDTSPLYHGATLRGVRIGPPESLQGFGGAVVIGTMLHASAIERCLMKLGVGRAIRLDRRREDDAPDWTVA